MANRWLPVTSRFCGTPRFRGVMSTNSIRDAVGTFIVVMAGRSITLVIIGDTSLRPEVQVSPISP